MRYRSMTLSALAFDEPYSYSPSEPRPRALEEPYVASAAEPRPRPYGKVGLSSVAKMNCLALVCVVKVGLGVLLLTHWNSGQDKRLETVLSVRTLADEQAPIPIEAPPEPSLPNMPQLTVTAPQFIVQSAAITPPPSQVAPVTPQAVSTPAPAAPKADANPYYQLVLRQIAQHKRYPAQAKRIRQEGLVEISFDIGADGRLLSAQVSQSSQVPSLDAAALAAVTAASPFPPIPAELGVNRLSLSLPIEFALR